MDNENTTFTTSKVYGNEIVKAVDFEFGFESLITNLSKFAKMIFECNQDFVIGGKVSVDSGTGIKVAPIFGVCASTGIPFGMTETSNVISIEQNETYSRVDILEAKGEWIDYDEQQRAFNDLDNNVITYRDVNTKQRMKVTYKIKKGENDSVTAPTTDEGFVKIAEIVYSAGTTELFDSDIKNITADIAGLENENWTNEKKLTYNIGYISDVNSKFRKEHNIDGSHANKIIQAAQLDIGVGDTQVNAAKFPLVSSGYVGSKTFSSADNVDAAFVKFALEISNLYNSYLKYGTYNFKGEVAICNVADEENKLTQPLILGAAGDGSAYVKIGTKSIFTVTNDGQIRVPSDYTALNTNDLITKGSVDKVVNDLDTQKKRIDAIIATSDSTVYSNGTLARFEYIPNVVACATIKNIDLANTSIIDSYQLQSGYIVIVKNQTDAKENGLYEFTSGGLVRHTNYDTFEKVKHKMFVIQNGAVNKNKIFYTPQENFVGTLGEENLLFSEYKKIRTEQIENNSISLNKIASSAIDTTPKVDSPNLITSGGVYAGYYNKQEIDKFNTYSVDETFTGEYYLGKPLYRKMVELSCPKIPNSGMSPYSVSVPFNLGFQVEFITVNLNRSIILESGYQSQKGRNVNTWISAQVNNVSNIITLSIHNTHNSLPAGVQLFCIEYTKL